MKIISGMTVYCRFKSKSPVASLRVGPRGGIYALVDGVWKYARKSRANAETAKEPLGPLNRDVRHIIKI